MPRKGSPVHNERGNSRVEQMQKLEEWSVGEFKEDRAPYVQVTFSRVEAMRIAAYLLNTCSRTMTFSEWLRRLAFRELNIPVAEDSQQTLKLEDE